VRAALVVIKYCSPLTATDLILPPPTEGSAEVAARVAAARDIQMARYAAAGLPHILTNAEAPASVLEAIAQPDAQGLKLLRDAAEAMRLSARGYHRVLRVARTLADLDGAEKIGRLHLAEALCPTAHWPKTSGAPREIYRWFGAWHACVNLPVTSFVYASPTISPASSRSYRRVSASCCVSRFWHQLFH
jgi:Magnesium chelatase, subunit ChlI C-terminal